MRQHHPQITQISRIHDRTIRLKESIPSGSTASQTPVIGLIGAGNYTGQVLLPALAKTGARLKTISSGDGVSGTQNGKKFGFELSTTDTKTIFDDPAINTVFVTARHNSYADIRWTVTNCAFVPSPRPSPQREKELKEIAIDDRSKYTI